jgi:hypothetical protein
MVEQDNLAENTVINDIKDFIHITAEKYLYPTLMKKGQDYAKQFDDKIVEDDTNNNFKQCAKRLNSISKYTVWSIYYLKHEMSLETWINQRDLKSEKLEGRLLDLINYLFILRTMIHEDNQPQEKITRSLDDSIYPAVTLPASATKQFEIPYAILSTSDPNIITNWVHENLKGKSF